MYQPSLKVSLSSILSIPLLITPISSLQAQGLPTQVSQQSKQATSKTPTLESLLSELTRAELLTGAELTEIELTETELPLVGQLRFAPTRKRTLDEFITDDVEISFFCGSSGEVPKTVVNNPLGEFTLIEWTKEFYPETNETPLDRCYSVASIFQDYYQQGLFSQIIAGEVGGAPAICVSDLSGNACGRVILLLEADENANTVADALQKSLLLLALESVQSVLPNTLDALSSINMSSTNMPSEIMGEHRATFTLPADEESRWTAQGSDNANRNSLNYTLEINGDLEMSSAFETHDNTPARANDTIPRVKLPNRAGRAAINPRETDSVQREDGTGRAGNIRLSPETYTTASIDDSQSIDASEGRGTSGNIDITSGRNINTDIFESIDENPEEAIAEEAIAEEAISDEAISEEAISEEAISDEAVYFDGNINVNDEIHLYTESLASYLRIVNNSEEFSAIAPPTENLSQGERVTGDRVRLGEKGGFLLRGRERLGEEGGFLLQGTLDSINRQHDPSGRVRAGGSR
ncbi:MAG: COP23 domain-containing protein [Cyanobacteria bacterium J06649_4]